MFRTSILASRLIAFSSIAVFAEDALQLTCSGTMIEPSALSPSPETVVLALGPAQKVTLDLGKGVVNGVLDGFGHGPLEVFGLAELPKLMSSTIPNRQRASD
jgi:hypothetical protein